MSGEQKQPLLKDGAEVEAQQPHPAQATSSGFLGLSSTLIIIIYYGLCSSTMLVINKVTVTYLPAPSFVLFCQLFVSALVVKLCALLGWLEADNLEWNKVKRFIWVIIGFLGTIFFNIKVLQSSNVETFITFRSSTPLVLSLCDFFFLGRALPSARSWGCLFVLLLGSIGYVLLDNDFQIRAYFWLMLWYGAFTFDTVYVKHMCENMKMTNWGRVYYTNLLALPFLAIILPAINEQATLMEIDWSNMQMLAILALSCMVGVCMSHAAYLLRDAVSATMFTIVGILCKILTVIINYFIWDKHAEPQAIACLMICVLAGTFYQQAPKRTHN